jgi:hypothetical protein
MLPYWASRSLGWKEALEEATKETRASLDELVDAISSPTENSSFDPADYILPKSRRSPMPYRLLIEINQAADPSDKSEPINPRSSIKLRSIISIPAPSRFSTSSVTP